MKTSNCCLYFLYNLFDYRYPCTDCGEKFTTGRARNQHHCGRPTRQPKRRRTDGAGPSHDHQDPEGTRSAMDGLFKIINLNISSDSPAVGEILGNETEKLADILRYVFKQSFSIQT